MKVSIVYLLALLAVARASTIWWLGLLPVMATLNEPVEGFFGIFRRRQPAKILDETVEEPMRFPVPQGQIGGNAFLPQNFPFAGSQGMFSPQSNFPPASQGMFSPPSSFPPSGSQGMFSPQNNFPPNFQGNWMNTWQGGNVQNSPEPQSIEEPTFDSESDRDSRFDDQPPAINTEEAESFFTLLAETDENKCISRLICEMGVDPNTAGDLGQTVSEIIGSLTDFPPGSKVSEYNEILRSGRVEGASSCLSKYSACDEETFLLMKNSETS